MNANIFVLKAKKLTLVYSISPLTSNPCRVQARQARQQGRGRSAQYGVSCSIRNTVIIILLQCRSDHFVTMPSLHVEEHKMISTIWAINSKMVSFIKAIFSPDFPSHHISSPTWLANRNQQRDCASRSCCSLARCQDRSSFGCNSNVREWFNLQSST